MEWVDYFYAFYILLILLKLPLLFDSIPSIWDKSKKLTWLQREFFHGVTKFAEYWHGYTIHYPKHNQIPSKSLLVGYHSRCTVDLVYFILALQHRFVIYHLLFEVPIFSDLFYQLGGIPSAKSHNHGKQEFIDAMIHDSRPLMVLPGGVFEMSKSYEDRYKLYWKKDPGFARVLVNEIYPIDNEICVVPFHTKNCEECFYTFPSWYTLTGQFIRSWAKRMNQGEAWLAPFFVTMVGPSLGMFLLPRPIKLETYLGEPIYVKENETSEQYGERVRVALQELVDRVEALPKQHHRINYYRIIKVTLIIIISLYQNFLVFAIAMILTWTVVPVAVIFHYLYRLYNHIRRSYRNISSLSFKKQD